MKPEKDAVSKLVFELSKLPGIGEKSATRLAYHLLKQDQDTNRALAHAILEAKEKTGLCPTCFTFSDKIPCWICQSQDRDRNVICVVEKPSDVHPIEHSGGFKGLYHVLHGVLSPLEGVGPEELRVRELLTRLPVREVILALNPSVEGEATALYILKLLKPLGSIKITQLAYGLPMGGTLEFSDRQTIGKALHNRMEMH